MRGRRIAVVGYAPYVGAAALAHPAAHGGGFPHLMPIGMHAPAVPPPNAQHVVQHVAPVPPAQWMGGKHAAGVYDPDEDLVPLPLIPDTNGGVFTATVGGTINWIGRVQKPFQGERVVAFVTPTGASAANTRGLAQFFVGTDPQMGQIGNVDLGVFAANAFGVRMKWTPAEPGIDIKIPVTLSIYPTGTDSVFISITVLGKILQ